MLTLAKCREILGGDTPQTDADLERLRDLSYGLARVGVEIFDQLRRRKDPPNAPHDCHGASDAVPGVAESQEPAGFAEALAMLPEDERYAVEERAAIMEFDGGLDRDVAERLALSMYWRDKRAEN